MYLAIGVILLIIVIILVLFVIMVSQNVSLSDGQGRCALQDAAPGKKQIF